MNRRQFLLGVLAAPIAAAAAPLVCPAPPRMFTVTFDVPETVIPVDLLERYIRPAAAQLADQINRDLFEQYVKSLPTKSFTLHWRT